MDKTCGTCRITKLVAEFYPNAKRRDGLSPRCVSCARAATNVSYRQLRARAVGHLGGACILCGYTEDARALVIDHIAGDGGQRRRAGDRGNAMLRSIIEGAAVDYQLLCANCNSIKRIADDERGNRIYTRIPPSDKRPHKRCSKCETVKLAADFGRNAARRDGLNVYCTACRRVDEAQRYRTLRVRVVSHLGGACATCGYCHDIRALAIDHVNGGGHVARQGGMRNTKLLNAVLRDEAGEYQVLCANCNTIKRFVAEEVSTRVYVRAIPTKRIDRPSERWTAEQRARQSEKARAIWDDPERRAAMTAGRSERMKRRWASGEVPNRRKPKPPTV